MKNYLLVGIVFISSVVFSQTGTTIAGSFMSGGVSRDYTFYVPAMYSPTKAVPLVFNIHGWTGTPAAQESYADFRKIADTANFIVVHPAAKTLPGQFPSWDISGPEADGIGDKNFLMALMDTMMANYNINHKKIYSTGFSQGGLMSDDFACFYSNRFTAIASVSGGMITEHEATCHPLHPIPVMEIHGTNDQLASYDGGLGLPVDSLINFWVKFNGCNPSPVVSNLPNTDTTDNSTVVHYVYNGGAEGSSVELYKVIGGDHQWPADVPTETVYGIGVRNKDFNASKAIWRFFSQYEKAVGIDEQVNNGNTILFYPNPSNGIFKMEIKNDPITILKIMNSFGETVVEKKVADATTMVDLSNSPKGIYFYQAINKTGIYTGKLIVE